MKQIHHWNSSLTWFNFKKVHAIRELHHCDGLLPSPRCCCFIPSLQCLWFSCAPCDLTIDLRNASPLHWDTLANTLKTAQGRRTARTWQTTPWQLCLVWVIHTRRHTIHRQDPCEVNTLTNVIVTHNGVQWRFLQSVDCYFRPLWHRFDTELLWLPVVRTERGMKVTFLGFAVVSRLSEPCVMS